VKSALVSSALEVVITPSEPADDARAMHALPGVQNADDGTPPFVRGREVSGIKVLLNNTGMLSPYNCETPTGNFTIVVNPFLLDGIFFRPGGFGPDTKTSSSLSPAYPPRAPSTNGDHRRGRTRVRSRLAQTSAAVCSWTQPSARNETRRLFRLIGAIRAYAPARNGADIGASRR
jgi:hypothetical protein